MPAIKREEDSKSPTPQRKSLETTDAFQYQHMGAKDPRLPQPPEPSTRAPHTDLALAPTGYIGSSPRKYRIIACDDSSYSSSGPIDLGGGVPPVFSRLPSRLGPAIATKRVNKTTSATTTTTTTRSGTSELLHITTLHKRIQHKTNTAQGSRHIMDEHDFEIGDDYMDSAMAREQEDDDDNVLVSRAEWKGLQNDVQALQHAHAHWQYTVKQQGRLIFELVGCNNRSHQSIDHLNARMKKMEEATYSRTQVQPGSLPKLAAPFQPAPAYLATTKGRRSRSPSRSPSSDLRSYRVRDSTGRAQGRKGRGRKDLEIKIPGEAHPGRCADLPTPLTFSATSTERTPMTPLTPGRAGPPSGTKMSSTCIHKRGIHNLDKMVPPIYAQLPLLPLTDTEVIVYFFNSLCRPIVSLRLYARKWGPAAISDVINKHRIVEPEYLRNTCSVKCTTAIKKGNDKYGPQWEIDNRAILEDKGCTDVQATDLIRLAEDEVGRAVDFELRALCNGLRKHPGEGDAGIFTRCVQYCQMNDADYKLSNVWQLASDLEAGRTPSRFANIVGSPDSADKSSTRAGSENPADSVVSNQTEADKSSTRAGSEDFADSVIGNQSEPSSEE